MKIINCYFILLILVLVSCDKKKDTLFSVVKSDYSGITFNNKIVETDSFNILTSEYIFNGGGVAVGDFNNDDKPDLFFTGNQVSNKLYINNGLLQFRDVSEISGIAAEDRWKTGVAVVDINNDDQLDVYVCAAMLPTASEKANMLFVNQGLDENGIPTFLEMAEKYGIADSGNSMNATFFDYNKDGHLDLYVLNNVDIHELPSNYRKKISDGSALSNDRLYRNNGDGTFTDVTLEAGITIEGYGLGIAVSDLNYDGWPDIYVSNDYLTNDIFYENNGDGTFTNTIKQLVKHQSKFSMGNDISDYNNDGFLDIITLDMLGETNNRMKTTVRNSKYNDYYFNEKFDYEYQYMRNMLQAGQGPGVPFTEIGLMAGVSKTDWSWAPLFVDADNDGLQDLLITNGFPRDITDLDFGEFNFNANRYLKPSQILDSVPVVKIPNYAFKNDGNGLFTDISKRWGLDIPSFSNGAVFADLDNDGDIDYIVNNINDEAFVFENHTDALGKDGHNYLAINLKGPKTNALGIGAKVVLRLADGAFQYQEHYLSRGYMSSVQNLLHFGLGKTKNIESLEVVWPDGKYQKLEGLDSNQTVTLNYGTATSVNAEAVGFPFVQENGSPVFKEVSKAIGVEYTHKENDVVDYNVQRVLPHKLTQNGPCSVSGDINGDGTEDFVIGSASGYAPEIFFQNKTGHFNATPLYSNENDKMFEEESMALFDIENDGDLDLYMVCGSNEFEKNSEFYTDRILLNDGKGNFSSATDRMPKINSSGSVVKTHDFDGDGFMDVFVGGRTPFAEYPLSERSYLLRNVDGVLQDVTDQYCPELQYPGMVTDAIWSDIDNDGFEDLILVGEFMPVTVFKNKRTKFERMKGTGMDDFFGWWECLIAEDFDKDGDVDIIAGNLGANNLYQPSEDRPITMLAKDFDGNGTIDPVQFAYFRGDYNDTVYKPYPINFWGDLSSQSPVFRSKFNLYKEYAGATQKELFDVDELENVITLTANHDKTSYFENMGDGTFNYRPLPLRAQIAPINNMVATDYDQDGVKDILMVGNNFGNEVFVGRYDAFNGAYLKGGPDGKFSVQSPRKSGFLITGDAKDLITVKNANGGLPYHVVTQNRGNVKVFQKNL